MPFDPADWLLAIQALLFSAQRLGQFTDEGAYEEQTRCLDLARRMMLWANINPQVVAGSINRRRHRWHSGDWS